MSDTIWIIIETAVDLYQGWLLTFFVYKFLDHRNEKFSKVLLPVFAAVFGAVVWVLNHISVYEGIASGLYILVLFVYSCIAFKDNIIKKLLASVIPVAVLLLVTTVELNLLASLKGILLTDLITDRGATRLLTLLLIQGTIGAALFIILKLFRYSDDYSFADWFPIIIVLTISFVLVSLIHRLSLSVNNEQRRYINLSYVVILLLNFLMFYMIYSLFLKNKQIREIKIYKLRQEHMEQYIKTSEAQYSSIRKLKHDMKDQMLSVYELLSNGRIDEAKSFISKNNRIISDSETYVKTDSMIANAVINSKLTTAAALGVKVSCITVSDFKGIDEVDLCELLGNMLENAVTACKEMPADSQRFIYLEIGRENDIYSFLVKNALERSVLESNPELKTSKHDETEHGLGVSIIKEIACKYNGRYDFYETDNAFCCSVILEV